MAATPIQPAQIMPTQERLLAAFSDGRYGPLLRELFKIEAETAPSPLTSRLLQRERVSVETEAICLLAQLSQDTLRHLLRNTYPQAHANASVGSLRDPYEFTGTLDPGVYLQQLVGADGLGISTALHEVFLSWLETTMTLSSPSEVGHTLSVNECRDAIDKAYRDVIATDDLQASFFATLNQQELDVLQTNVRRYIRSQRTVHAQAKAQDVNHISIHAEIGLAKNLWDRCGQHKRLASSSPPLLRLVHLVLRAAFPDRDFRMLQVVLFHATRISDLETGASLGALLCASYLRSGGINTIQAGQGVGTSGSITGDEWEEMLNRLVDNRLLRFVNPNLEQDIITTTRLRGIEEKRLQQAQMKIQYQKDLQAIDRLIPQVEEATASATRNLQEVSQQIDTLEALTRQQEEWNKNILPAAAKFIHKLQKVQDTFSRPGKGKSTGQMEVCHTQSGKGQECLEVAETVEESEDGEGEVFFEAMEDVE